MIGDELIGGSDASCRPTDVFWCIRFALDARVEDCGDRVWSEIDTEFCLEAADDLAGGCEHLLGRGFDEFDVRSCPVGDIWDRVRTGVDAKQIAHDIGDGFGFDLDAVASHARLANVGRMHDHVPEFVDLGLERLGGFEVVANGDSSVDEVGDAFGAAGSVERSSLERVPGAVDLFGDGIPDLRRWLLSVKEFRLYR